MRIIRYQLRALFRRRNVKIRYILSQDKSNNKSSSFVGNVIWSLYLITIISWIFIGIDCCHYKFTHPYWFWLVVQVLKSNIDVCKRILNPKLPINPQLIMVKASQVSNLAKVIYANSITLTPGTISIDLDGSNIEVHSLSNKGANGLKAGDMDRKITSAEANPYV